MSQPSEHIVDERIQCFFSCEDNANVNCLDAEGPLGLPHICDSLETVGCGVMIDASIAGCEVGPLS